MLVPQKSQYALRAVFELAKRAGQGPVKTAEIANEQAIPRRFLEVILHQLKQAGIVASERGARGGYLLARSPQELTVGDIMRFMDGPIGPVECVAGDSAERCSLYGHCVFLPMWEKVRRATEAVYDHTSFDDLVEQEKRLTQEYVPIYSI